MTPVQQQWLNASFKHNCRKRCDLIDEDCSLSVRVGESLLLSSCHKDWLYQILFTSRISPWTVWCPDEVYKEPPFLSSHFISHSICSSSFSSNFNSSFHPHSHPFTYLERVSLADELKEEEDFAPFAIHRNGDEGTKSNERESREKERRKRNVKETQLPSCSIVISIIPKNLNQLLILQNHNLMVTLSSISGHRHDWLINQLL